MLLLLCTSHNSAYSQYHISPYEIVYEDMRYLQVSGLISTLNLGKVPILNSELFESMEYDRKSDIYKRLNKRQSELFSKIESSYTDVSHRKDFDRFPGWLRKMFNYFSSADSEDSYFYLGGICNVFCEKKNDVSVSPFLRNFGMVSMPYGISFVNVMTIDTRATDNPDYIGKEWRGLSGYTEQAYLQWDSKCSRLTFGRSYMINGLGRKGSLLFSQFCRPVDYLRLEFFLKRFSFQSLMGLEDLSHHIVLDFNLVK